MKAHLYEQRKKTQITSVLHIKEYLSKHKVKDLSYV